MQLREPTRFKALRRRLTLLAIGGPVFAVAAVACWSREIQWAAFVMVALAIICSLLLPGPLLRGGRSGTVKEITTAETLSDLIRSMAMILLFFWIQSLPEFAALLERLFHRNLWDPLLLLAAGLWAFSSAYRNAMTVRALSDRQIFRYFQGDSTAHDAAQTYRRIDSGDGPSGS
ncbi:MAG: hypothetical protein JWO82_1943 [Akkermansiaceae bacterium]|nr:hypothetical protein [Akkermansiaceae bacterium]